MSERDDVFAAWDAAIGVRTALAAARDGVDALLRDRGLRRTTPAITAESLLLGAAASARLEGSLATVSDLRAGDADAVASAAARMNAGLPALVPVVQRSPLQAFARLHTLAAAGSVPDDELGRPRADGGAALRLRSLSEALLHTHGAPGIAVAALAHAEIAAAEPFTAYNGLVARGVERLLLAATGVDPAGVLVPEAGHLAHADEYPTTLAAYAAGGRDGRTRWLLYSAAALANAVTASPLAN